MKVSNLITVLTFVAVAGSIPAAYANVPDGSAIYSGTCVACHGQNGKGLIPGTPDFTSEESPLTSKNDAVLLKEITEGYRSPGSPMAMPAKGGNPALGEEDILAVIKYIRDTFGSKSPH